MVSLVKRFFKIRIIRYGLVGGLGIPINDGALFLYWHLTGLPYPLANAFAFLTSNFINFVLNQFFTYREQLQHIHGREWAKRFVKGIGTSLSASLIAYLVALALVHFFNVNGYIANPLGIIVAFVYNFFISKKLVFRSIEPQTPSAPPAPAGVRPVEEMETMPLQALSRVEPTPQ